MWIFSFISYTLPCFIFCWFLGLSLPYHLLCYLFFFLFLFVCLFFFHGFSAFFLPSWIICSFFIFLFFLFKKKSLIALGTSSLHLVMSPLGLSCTAPPFRSRVSTSSKLCNWWFGKVRGLINKIWWIWYFEETVDDGVGRTMPGREAVSGCSPLWLVMAGRSGVNCFVLFILLKIHGDCWQGAGLAKSSQFNCYRVGITGPGATYAVMNQHTSWFVEFLLEIHASISLQGMLSVTT